ncbi:MotA/TolQ/ExbB proton channel family protein [Endozoicomonas sp. SM1973]|uniref:MotA/TolQ/ExbB proton channel family protein n=1 Tax=Spartinivicinus marinus TaxID=2994442 RepID=A0A853I9I5_9GAMM|nr:MotA/TolQ/ExbB proton channel family protein [Spartinivicinus marinus]MCX4026336.1 MotA/TolQ/ExbB proton channel family protein [Spartinivicinus marinus]NYZ67318.1 MotA/TolQ/ExbB proton channel family protein [Spartinivicinus marinus]
MNIDYLQQALNAMGWMLYPLAFCSLLMIALILERLCYFLLLPLIPDSKLSVLLSRWKNNVVEQPAWLQKKQRGIAVGIKLLSEYQGKNVVREQQLSCWLAKQHQTNTARLKLLQLIGMISPLLGLLGTILGMIVMFKGVAQHQGPVTPNILADGLWQAMYTTAFGLVIAVPAIVGAQLFYIWSNSYCQRLQHWLNAFHCQMMVKEHDEGSLESNSDQNLKAVA